MEENNCYYFCTYCDYKMSEKEYHNTDINSSCPRCQGSIKWYYNHKKQEDK